MNEAENNQEQGKESKKVAANFEQTVKKLTAIVAGKENLKMPRRVPKDSIQGLVEELFKEESEATAKQVKEDLKALLKGYVQLNTSIAEEQKKLEALKTSKMKEFNATAAKLFNKIEGIDSLTKDYQEALGVAKGVIEKTDDDNSEE